jgi:hypothetical protein
MLAIKKKKSSHLPWSDAIKCNKTFSTPVVLEILLYDSPYQKRFILNHCRTIYQQRFKT